MTPRHAAIDSFLASAGWGDTERLPLAGDASARRYVRLRGRDTAVLMDVPPGSGLDVMPFVHVTDWLRDGGLSAPRILAAAPSDGLLLLEDLGDDLYANLCAADPGREPELYGAAVDLLGALQRRPPPAAGWSPPAYDLAFLQRELALMPEWYLGPATGAAPSADLVAEYQALTTDALAPVVAAPPVPVLRDYHAENLIWLPGRAGVARVGLLDYQDMLLGHPAYDLVSLLADARRDTSPELRTAMTARYLAATGAEPEAFGYAAQLLSVQRNLKILGIFARLARRDGKPRYLDLMPRVWGHIDRDLGRRDLAPLAAFIRRHIPAPAAGVIARLAA